MKQDGRLARMLHVLIHMGLLGGRETSETIAEMLNTNPVVVRRTMGALRLAGIVSSVGGRGGGWVLLRTLDDLSILDVRNALDDGPLLPAGVSDDHPACPVERATNGVLATAFRQAEKVLLTELSSMKLSKIAEIAVGAATDSQD